MAVVFLRWKGDEVYEKALEAAALAIDQTNASCVHHAKTHHPWQNREYNLEQSIQMRGAQTAKLVVTGKWGVFGLGAKARNGSYAIYLETGTSRMRPYPYLHPAADEEYPKLVSRIAKAFNS